MLDDREQQILRDIERELAAADPALPPTSTARSTAWRWRWPIIALALGLAIGIFLMVLGLVGNGLLLVAIATIPGVRRWWRRRRDGRCQCRCR